MTVLSCFDVDPVRDLLALACSYEVNFEMKDGVGWFSYNFNDSVASRVPAYEGVNRGGGFTQVKVRGSSWNVYTAGGMRADFAELA